jgi:hypothetical protein
MADVNRRCFMKMLSGAALTTPWLLQAAEKGQSAAASAPVTEAFCFRRKRGCPTTLRCPSCYTVRLFPDGQSLRTRNNCLRKMAGHRNG